MQKGSPFDDSFDGVVTDEEAADLNTIAEQLRLASEDVTAAIEWARANSETTAFTRSTFALQAGDRIVFTGEITTPRDEWVKRIVAAGLVTGGVTKSTKLLVAADPDSMSGKAAKARTYGVPVVSEAAVEKYFAEYLDSTLGQTTRNR